MKTKEELDAIKNEMDSLKKRLAELTEDELEQVVGGVKVSEDTIRYCKYCNKDTMQSDVGMGNGYDPENHCMTYCFLWKCHECDCTNYWDAWHPSRLL